MYVYMSSTDHVSNLVTGIYIYKEAAKESAGVRAIRIMQKKNVVMISVPRSVLASVPCRCYAGSKPHIRRGAAL